MKAKIKHNNFMLPKRYLNVLITHLKKFLHKESYIVNHFEDNILQIIHW
jgi:hypothetical protein